MTGEKGGRRSGERGRIQEKNHTNNIIKK